MKKCEIGKALPKDCNSRWEYATADEKILSSHNEVCFAPIFGRKLPADTKYIYTYYPDVFSLQFPTEDRKWAREYLNDLQEMGFFRNVEPLSMADMLSRVGKGVYYPEKYPSVCIKFDVTRINVVEFLMVASAVRLLSEYPHYLYVYFRLKKLFPNKPLLLYFILCHDITTGDYTCYYGDEHCVIGRGRIDTTITLGDVHKKLDALKIMMSEDTKKGVNIQSLWVNKIVEDIPKGLDSNAFATFMETL